MRDAKTFSSRMFDVINAGILILISLSILYPFLYIFSLSTSDGISIARGDVVLFPVHFTLGAYKYIFTANLGQAYLNTVFYAGLGTCFTLLFCCLGAYPLCMPRFRGKAFFTLVFTITMFFSGGMIPTFFTIQKLGMLDTFWAVTLPGAFGFYNIIILRTNFKNIPDSLVESAVIDGANDWKILFRIMIPLSKAILATITLWTVVGVWNNYFGPLLYLTSPDKEPLSVFLRRVLVSRFVEDSMSITSTLAKGSTGALMKKGLLRAVRMATVLVSIGPIIIAYPFIQKYFVKGVLIGSIKG